MVAKEEILVADGRRRSGWFWIDNEVFDLQLKPSVFMVYCFLVRIADRGSEIACISIRKMAKILDMSPWTVQKALKKLEDLNMIRKTRRETAKGNKIANLYRLTPKEDWVYQKMAQGVPKNGTGCTKKWHRGVSKNSTPRRSGVQGEVENHVEERAGCEPINNYKDQKLFNQKYNHHHHISNGDGDEKKDTEEKSLEKIYSELIEKWKGIIGNTKFKRLSIPQVIFFLENSALPPEKALEMIRKDDENPKVKNPVGTLYTTLPMKGNKHRWLLKYTEPCGWYVRYVEKIKSIREFFKRHGIEFIERNVKTEEEAEKHLRELEYIASKYLWNKLDSSGREEIMKKLKKFGEYSNSFLIEIMSGSFGLSHKWFSLYLQ